MVSYESGAGDRRFARVLGRWFDPCGSIGGGLIALSSFPNGIDEYQIVTASPNTSKTVWVLNLKITTFGNI